MRIVGIIFFLFSSLFAVNPLQDAIDKASPHAIIKLQNGIYKGNITITKPLSIVGLGNNVIIEGEQSGSVITITSSHVKLQNLQIRGSGDHMYAIDAAISMHHVNSCEIIQCHISDALYGIDMDMVTNSLIKNNYITSKSFDIPLRGDGLKLYYSNKNTFDSNIIEKVRDVTLNYSNENLFTNNQFLSNRFSTHISLSRGNVLRENRYRYNSVSIMLMGAKDTNVSHNTIHSSNGAAGIGVMIGAVSNFLFEKNSVRYNAKALYIDGKEKEKGIKRFIIDNEIAYNGEAFHFHATIKDNNITKNRVFGNIEDVVKDVEGSFDPSNRVAYNYWDRYSGFDRDNDGIGDTPYEVYQYADKLWQYNKTVKFFYASPIMTLLNFLSQLAPFIEPNMVMKDNKPLVNIN